MSSIVLIFELTDIKFIMKLGMFIDGNVQGYSFRLSKKYKPTKQAVCCTRNLHGFVWNIGRLDYSELHNILLSDVKVEYFAKEPKEH